MATQGLLDVEWSGWDAEELATSRRAKLKGVIFISFCVLIYSCLVVVSQSAGPLPSPSLWRTGAQCLLALGMFAELFVEFVSLPPPVKSDVIYPLMQMIGKPIFLTFWILSVQTVQACVSLIAEASLLFGVQFPSLFFVSYAACHFVGTLGVVLTLLFLKFNYFEEKWHLLVRDMWEKRGFRFGLLSLIGHVPSLPIGILDIVVKDRDLLMTCALPFDANLGLIAFFVVIYVSWIHIWWAASGFKCWPYPFLYEFDTCLKRIVFALVIFIAVSIVLSGMSLLQ